VRYLGITSDANVDNAIDFVQYSLGEGYTQTLSIAPEGKFPVRRGDATDAEKYVKIWEKLPVGVDRKAPLSELYEADIFKEIVAGLDKAQRWGVTEGQLSLASKIINSQIINRLIRSYIGGESDAVATVAALTLSLLLLSKSIS
jgi:multiple sugar transport system substrate-binding protein